MHAGTSRRVVRRVYRESWSRKAVRHTRKFFLKYIYIYEIVGWSKTILSPMGNVGNKYGGSWKGLVRIFQLCHTEVAFSSVTIAGFVADIDLVN